MIRELDTMIGTAAALEAASASMRRDYDDRRHALDLTVPVMAAIAVVVLLYLASRGGARPRICLQARIGPRRLAGSGPRRLARTKSSGVRRQDVYTSGRRARGAAETERCRRST